jgi:hypothetical protein
MPILSQQKQSQAPDFPNLRPSLDLRFALAKKLDPRITFTRGSTGTYFGPDGLMRTAGVNEPRFDHDPVTGQSLGLLVEEQRTNLLLDSNNFSNWTLQSGSGGATGISTNVITSPDGTTNASKLFVQTQGGGTAFYSIYKSVSSIFANIYYVFSVFIKSGEGTAPSITIFDGTNNSTVFINLTTASITSSFTAVNMTFDTCLVTNFNNGWYRVSIPFVHTVGGTFQFKINTGVNILNYGIYLYGAQLERGVEPTSYIPTTNVSTATRSPDIANMTGTNFSSWFNQNEGTFLSIVKPSYAFPSITNFTNKCPMVVYYDNNLIHFILHRATQPQIGTRSPVNYFINVSYLGPGNLDSTSERKVCYTYKDNYYNAVVNRQTTTPDIRGEHAKTANGLGLNSKSGEGYATSNSFNGLNALNGTISRLTYYPIQLTNQQLINLTS